MNQLLKWLTHFKKECPVCTGTGNIACECNENNEITCPSCNGKGVVARQVTATQKTELPCDNPQCQQGKVVCGICNGTGKNQLGQVCAACHGSGKVNCSVCGGLGRIERVKQESWLEHETCHICNGRGVVSCYLCQGTKVRVCPTCKGKGTVLDKGKIMVLSIVALLVFCMPVLFIVLAVILLGGSLFLLAKEHEPATAEEQEPLQTDDCDESNKV